MLQWYDTALAPYKGYTFSNEVICFLSQDSPTFSTAESPHETHAWRLLLAARRSVDDGAQQFGLRFDTDSEQVEFSGEPDTQAELFWSATLGWQWHPGLAEEVVHFFELYLPILGTPANPKVIVAHLGQSIDARIATSSGDAFFVTGEENRKHLHRLRALCQAVVVGSSTVLADNPRLTTRAVRGENPVRVILDGSRRIPQGMALLNDKQAPTWLLRPRPEPETGSVPESEASAISQVGPVPGRREILVPLRQGTMQPDDILKALAREGIHRVFIEGGGITVSRFYNSNCLTRLQVATAPVLVGEGIPSIQLPGSTTMAESRRPDYKLYQMGQDVMWDFDMRVQNKATPMAVGPGVDTSPETAGPSLKRLA